MNKILITLFVTVFFTINAYAQDSRKVGSQSSPSSLQPDSRQRQKKSKYYKKHPFTIYYDRLIVEYEQRMKANAKKYKVMARKMQKPQYSDPSYFGHKRKPRKRPVGKRKYCQECEIVH